MSVKLKIYNKQVLYPECSSETGFTAAIYLGDGFQTREKIVSMF
jgi:hypothetical protein